MQYLVTGEFNGKLMKEIVKETTEMLAQRDCLSGHKAKLKISTGQPVKSRRLHKSKLIVCVCIGEDRELYIYQN